MKVLAPNAAEPRGDTLLDVTSAPPHSGSRRVTLWVSGLLCATAGLGASACALIGAWPVVGFVGLELPLVAGLIWSHRRRAGHAWERVVLADGELRISHRDERGRQAETVLEPYWTRLENDRRPGHAGEFRLRCRDRAVTVGRFLSEEDRAALAVSVRDALRQYREPRFDNPQLLPRPGNRNPD